MSALSFCVTEFLLPASEKRLYFCIALSYAKRPPSSREVSAEGQTEGVITLSKRELPVAHLKEEERALPRI